MSQPQVQDEEIEYQYPIISMSDLRDVGRGGLLRWRAPKRHPKELPRPKAGHHVLVYRVDGRYVRDDVSRGVDDDQVVKATQVTEVDMTRNSPVVVRFDINSKDHSVFTVVVTFECTVVDPITVVQDGVTRPDSLLLNYLRSHHNASQMGLGFTLSEIHEARRYVNAQLTAYRTHIPPELPGIEVRMTSIDIRTPREEAEDADNRRTMARRHGLEKDRLGLDHDLEHEQSRLRQTQERVRMEYETALRIQRAADDYLIGRSSLEQQTSLEAARIKATYGLDSSRLDNEQMIDIQHRRHDQEKGRQQQEYDDQLRLMAQRAELHRKDEIEEYRFHKLQQAIEVIGNDPDRALLLSYLAGEVEATELFDRIRSGQEEAILYTRAEADKDRAERLQVQAELHEQRLKALGREQDEAIAKLAAEREDLAWQRDQDRRQAERDRIREAQQFELERTQNEYARTEEKEHRHWAREDELAKQKIAAEAARRRDDAQLQVIRELIQRGLLDANSVDLEQIVTKLSGQNLDEIIASDELPSSSGEIPPRSEREDDTDDD